MKYVLCSNDFVGSLAKAEEVMTDLLNGNAHDGFWIAVDGDDEYQPVKPQGYPYTLRWIADGKLIAEPA